MAEHRTLLDGVPVDLVAAAITDWHHAAQVDSTMDVAHQLAAEGAPSGTVVIADVQSAGRGRAGKDWLSRAGDGVWCTLVERDVSPAALQVLSLRIGLALAEALAPWADGRLWLKWPNDLLCGPSDALLPAVEQLGKLAGVLVEARWREAQVEWVAIGVGVNLRLPEPVPAGVRPAALQAGVRRADVLAALMPRLRAATRCDGALAPEELAAWQARDAMRGRRCVSPAPGVVQGIDATGALLVRSGAETRAHRSGSLLLLP